MLSSVNARLLCVGFVTFSWAFCFSCTNDLRAEELNAADKELENQWNAQKDVEAAEMARQHIQGLVRAAHAYWAEHGTLPPAVVPNRKLPAGKRLSGLVLLLPYLDAKLSYDKRPVRCFDPKVVKLANDVYKSIDRTKAWDDPVNLKAAKTIIPAFLAPQSGSFRDAQGFAVTHFAFVQGSANGPDGAFPDDRGLKLSDISDGPSNTLAMGQIVHDLGPWIAEGLSTARQMHAPTDTSPGTFGSLYHKSGCYIAFCDASSSFMACDEKELQRLATRNGQDFVGDFARIKNPFEHEPARAEWSRSRR